MAPGLLIPLTSSFTEALNMVLAGEIVDSMTIIAMLWADRLTGRDRN